MESIAAKTRGEEGKVSEPVRIESASEPGLYHYVSPDGESCSGKWCGVNADCWHRRLVREETLRTLQDEISQRCVDVAWKERPNSEKRRGHALYICGNVSGFWAATASAVSEVMWSSGDRLIVWRIIAALRREIVRETRLQGGDRRRYEIRFDYVWRVELDRVLAARVGRSA